MVITAHLKMIERGIIHTANSLHNYQVLTLCHVADMTDKQDLVPVSNSHLSERAVSAALVS